MQKLVSLGLAALALTAAAAAQSFNVDISVAPSLTPPSTFGAYPNQPGVWNAIHVVPGQQMLSRLDGAPDNSNAQFLTPVPGTGFNTGIPQAFLALYEDFATSSSPFTLQFDNLDAGDYVAVVYSYAPNAQTLFRLIDEFNGVASQDIVTCPPLFPAQGYVANNTIALLPFTVFTQNAAVKLQALTDTTSALNGVQLVRYVGTLGCHQPLANSLGAWPAPIATGTVFNDGILASANDLAMHVGVLPGSLPNGIGSILCWVSNEQNNNVTYSCPYSGVLCIGPGSLVRVADPAAPPGAGGVGQTTAYGTYSIGVDLPTLAAQGLNTVPGAKLYFQFIYRDADYLAQCSPGGVVGRWTESVEVKLY